MYVVRGSKHGGQFLMVNINSWAMFCDYRKTETVFMETGVFVLYFSSESRTRVNDFDVRTGVP